MGAGPDVWGKGGRTPRRQQELATLLCTNALTVAEIAREAGISRDDVGHTLRRLREKGFEVRLLDSGEQEPLYRVRYPRGRVCAAPGCGTLLRRSNPSDRCEVHGGGFVVAPEHFAAPWGGGRRPNGSDVDWRALRETCGLSQREVARRAAISSSSMARIEAGEQRASRDVAQRLATAMHMTVMRR